MRYGKAWPLIAARVRHRDKYTCQVCGRRQKEDESLFHVHHLHPRRDFSNLSEANKLKNLMTVCPSCHRKKEKENPFRQQDLPLDKTGQRNNQTQGTNSIGRRIREVRNGLKLSQYALAQRIGISLSKIRAIENDKGRLTTGALLNIGCTLDVDIVYLMCQTNIRGPFYGGLNKKGENGLYGKQSK